jgi:hypothetical protein
MTSSPLTGIQTVPWVLLLQSGLTAFAVQMMTRRPREYSAQKNLLRGGVEAGAR